jgi:hypothetical protein
MRWYLYHDLWRNSYLSNLLNDVDVVTVLLPLFILLPLAFSPSGNPIDKTVIITRQSSTTVKPICIFVFHNLGLLKQIETTNMHMNILTIRFLCSQLQVFKVSDKAKCNINLTLIVSVIERPD